MFELIINLGIPVLTIAVAMITGSILERNHYKSIEKRETENFKLPILTGRQFPTDRPVLEARLVQGSVVISIDYFKRFLASLRNIFGGEVVSYCSLLDRARREAILRMKEEWPDADLIVNMRVETSSIAQGGKKALGSTEILAYGTAIKFGRQNEDS